MVAKRDERAQVNHARSVTQQSDPLPFHLSLAEVRQLIALLNSTDLTEISLARPANGMKLVLRRTSEPATVATPLAVPAPLAAALPAAPAAAAAPAEPAYEPVTAPLVGVFYPSVKPGQKPLVSIGDKIREGQVIGAIETLRVMNEVESRVSGRVVEIRVTPGQAVEYGQTLLLVEPE
jgi:acetyl-CoA carboxylase biotin carboxyl carrier protein